MDQLSGPTDAGKSEKTFFTSSLTKLTGHVPLTKAVLLSDLILICDANINSNYEVQYYDLYC